MRQAFGDGIVHRAHNQLGAQFLRPAVAEADQFGKFVAGLDVKERHRNVRGPERLFGQAQQADGVFAAGEQQHRSLKLRRHFTHHVNGLGFQILQMIQMITAHFMRM